MRITVRQLKSIIKEAVDDEGVSSNNFRTIINLLDTLNVSQLDDVNFSLQQLIKSKTPRLTRDAKNKARKELFRYLDDAANSGNNPDFWSNDLTELEKVTSEENWKQLKQLYTDDEIMKLVDKWHSVTKYSQY